LIPYKLQQFAQDRVLGSSAKIAFYGPNGPVTFAEVDTFKSTRKSTQKQFQPLGEVGEHTQDIYQGWSFDFSGGVIDPSFDDIVDQIDQAAQNGQKNLRFRVTETTTYYDGTQRVWVYPDSVLFGFDKDISAANSEIKWTGKGEAQKRIPG
jgi:hypothetical protein